MRNLIYESYTAPCNLRTEISSKEIFESIGERVVRLLLKALRIWPE